MNQYRISNPVQLGFNPATTLDEQVRCVFQDPVARTLWMGLRVGHIVDQHFTERVLTAAKYCKENGIPRSVEELQKIIQVRIGAEYGSTPVAQELLPYITGQKILNYEVATEKREVTTS